MVKSPIFEELKCGDKLICIDVDGQYRLFTYLCRDPRWASNYAFFIEGDGSTARHLTKKQVESELLIYSDWQEIVQEIRKKKAEYYKNYLKRYENNQLKTYEV